MRFLQYSVRRNNMILAQINADGKYKFKFQQENKLTSIHLTNLTQSLKSPSHPQPTHKQRLPIQQHYIKQQSITINQLVNMSLSMYKSRVYYNQHQQQQPSSLQSSMISQQQQPINNCILCIHQPSHLLLWLQTNLYRKQNNFYGRYIKSTNLILRKSPSSFSFISYKEAMIQAHPYRFQNQLQYKQWRKILAEIKNSIETNCRDGERYDRVYFGRCGGEVMMKYQVKRRLLKMQQRNFLVQRTNNVKSQNSKKQLKQRLSQRRDVKPTPSGGIQSKQQSPERILQNSQLRTCYEFVPVSLHRQQPVQSSLIEVQRLKHQLSQMISQLKLNDSTYPQCINMTKPFIDYNRSKDELKFKNKLAQNISDILKEPSSTRVKTKNIYKDSKINNNPRLFTSPDLGNDENNSYLENKCMEMYGCLSRQNPQMIKKINKNKQSSNNKLSRDKLATTTNLSRQKIRNNKYSRQQTEHSTNSQLVISSTSGSNHTGITSTKKSKSKSKLKTQTTLPSATSPSRHKLTTITSQSKLPLRQKSNTTIKQRKLLTQTNKV